MRFYFIGEQPSAKAHQMRVTWRDGRLAAKQLFDALRVCGITPEAQCYDNWFAPSCVDLVGRLKRYRSRGWCIVAMGQKVSRAMRAAGVAHLHIVHPAARGKIRLKSNYAAHVRSTLLEGA